jgi:S-sulfosulfanyl-L-cysteine sulfohydrolase
LQRREFLRILGAAGVAGATLRPRLSAAQAAAELYDAKPYGNVSLLHITDTHAQLLPVHFREPFGLERYRLKPGTRLAYAHTRADFVALAKRYGRVGGFAHLATLLKRLRASRPHALLLDGGDSWQGSATALWTKGADMMGAQERLGVDYMTAHWEFTYGMARVKESKLPLLAQNVRTADFEDPVFEAYALRELNGVPVAIIGQAFPYTPIANPRHFVPQWTFGIQEARLQGRIDEARAKGARAVVLLSHNGSHVDLKLAARVRGLDAILGGHTHDGFARPVRVGSTLVTNAGSNGKFVGVLDMDVGADGVKDLRYRLLPVFANLLDADAAMAAYIAQARRPFEAKLGEKLATTEGLLYRRGSFNGTFDELILRALLKEKDAEIAFSPGFRWGTTLLPGEALTLEHLMDQTAITYPQTTLNELSGAQIKAILEDIADNVFHADPYLQQGGDMVRVAGMSYELAPKAKIGSRISALEIAGKPLQSTKRYKVAGWAPVAEGITGEPIWDVVARYLRATGTVPPLKAQQPRLAGTNPSPNVS